MMEKLQLEILFSVRNVQLALTFTQRFKNLVLNP